MLASVVYGVVTEPQGRNMVARSMKGAMGENSARPSMLVPMVMGVPLVGGGGGAESRLIVNQLKEVVTAVPEPKLVESTPALAALLKALALTTEPRVIHLLSSLELRRYCAVMV